MLDVTNEQTFNLLKVAKDFIKIKITHNTTFFTKDLQFQIVLLQLASGCLHYLFSYKKQMTCANNFY